MSIRVLLFASYRQQAGTKELALDAGATPREVARQLEARFPSLTLKGALCAVNERYADPDEALKPGDTVAFFPPVSGGEQSGEHLFVTEAELELPHYFALVRDPRFGAIASFVGSVRSPNDGAVVHAIDYQGYEAMILSQMRVVASEVRERFKAGRVVLAHRLGRLEPGEASIAIVIAAVHRAEALSACHYAIERCKALLPVWKREATSQGERWVPGTTPDVRTL
jgi:molybdopterin converting factor subunit 1